MDEEINTLNTRLSSSIHARDAETNTLSGKRNELDQASAKYKELDERVKLLSPRANDPLQSRPFLRPPDYGRELAMRWRKNKSR